MSERRRVFSASLGTATLFLLVQLGALALVEPFRAEGFQPVENPSDPTNSIVYVALILVATAGMLAVFRYGGQNVVRLTLIAVAGFISWYVFVVFLPTEPSAFGAALLPLAAALLVVVALYVHPEWYVIDGAGVIMGAGAAGLFGIGFGPLPALILLSVLAVYDAISVYGTEHMLTLAEGVMEMKVPVLLVIPTTLSFSFRDLAAEESSDDEAANPESVDESANADDSDPDESTDADASEGDAPGAESGPLERDALFIGLGDAVIPTVLVASAGAFLDAPPLVEGIALNAPALGGMVGTMVGLAVLLRLVFAGRAHAGLPLLNTGAIVGYLVAVLATDVSLAAALGL